MSSSMKLFNPNYHYGAAKSNYSESHEEEYISQSNYVDSSWAGTVRQPGYNYQAREHQTGHSMRSCDDGIANNSANYFAQDQCAKPNTSINVIQNANCVERWAKKPNYKSGPAQGSQYGLAMHKEEHLMGKAEQGCANKPTQNAVMGLGNEYGMKGNQRGIVVHEEDHVEEKVESKLVNKTTPFSGPTRANQYGQSQSQSMYKEPQSDGACEGVVENLWANMPDNSLGPTQSFHSMQGMHKDHQGWANSPTKFYGPQSNIGQRPNSPSNFLAPIKTNNSGLNMYEDQHIMGQSDHVMVNPPTQLPDPIQGNQYDGGWANQPITHSGANQVGYSGNNMYNEQGQHGFGGSQFNHAAHGLALTGFGSARTDYSSHGVAQNGFGSGQANYSAHGAAPNGYGSAHRNYSNHGVGHNGVGSAQANHSAYGATQSGFWPAQANHSADGATQSGFGSAQANHSAYGAMQSGFGSAQTNYSAHDEADEDVHEIMDEILAKYPAQNVSGGKPKTCAGQNQGGSYAEQQSFVGPAQEGMVSQTSSNKLEMRNEVKEGYMGNMKKEFSHSSSSNKLEANGALNKNGGLYGIRIDHFDF